MGRSVRVWCDISHEIRSVRVWCDNSHGCRSVRVRCDIADTAEITDVADVPGRAAATDGTWLGAAGWTGQR